MKFLKYKLCCNLIDSHLSEGSNSLKFLYYENLLQGRQSKQPKQQPHNIQKSKTDTRRFFWDSNLLFTPGIYYRCGDTKWAKLLLSRGLKTKNTTITAKFKPKKEFPFIKIASSSIKSNWNKISEPNNDQLVGLDHDLAINSIKNDPKRPRSKRAIVALFGLSSLSLTLWLFGKNYFDQVTTDNSIFNPPRFTPFEVINRQDISSTAFMLTIRTAAYLARDHIDLIDPFKEWWERGIWSVEAKQPELQIARSYTPLPPEFGEPQDHLRFLIRREYHGEMSEYLNQLKVGSTIYLRGPYQELEIPKDVKEVLFLAGGTGIAPALQVAHGILERRKLDDNSSPFIRIIWANRRREDCQGGGINREKISSSSLPTVVEGAKHDNPIVNDLERMQQQYLNNFDIKYLVDEENTRLTPKIISQFLPRKESSQKLDLSSQYQQKEQRQKPRLLIVSGPPGFINFIAGPKEWRDGRECQGKLGGALEKLHQLSDNWIVWKL